MRRGVGGISDGAGAGNGSRGFTMIELSAVLTLLALLAATTIPSFVSHFRRARAVDAVYNLHSLASLENAHRLMRGSFLACAPAPAAIPKGKPAPWQGNQSFDDLGFRGPEQGYFQYQVILDPKGFRAVAQGDLNGDGVTSHFELQSWDSEMLVQRELE